MTPNSLAVAIKTLRVPWLVTWHCASVLAVANAYCSSDDAIGDRVQARFAEEFYVGPERSDALNDATSPRPVDDCHVVAPEECAAECQPVYSGSTVFGPEICDLEGVFFGCVPSASSAFWDMEGENGEEASCDMLRNGDPHFYCFEGKYALYWYWKHVEMFCRGYPCTTDPITDCIGR